MTIKHLHSDYINNIASGLDEDVYGANGDLDEFEIDERLIENIHEWTGHQYFRTGVMPVWHAARMVRSVWEYMDRKHMEEITQVQKIVASK
jgi:hypothetical protein